ncbi:hypothetical protein AMTR_s00014p00223250 [Amborella trichopoda]|uniref:Uncharacterized protein n=1 Tax=Amborella trichopoda TaxID=13333 RepID=W1PGP7_AMBTC|nr:hypothetical protein AMTR_s00014p00223250 [Amborella trichopoda]
MHRWRSDGKAPKSEPIDALVSIEIEDDVLSKDTDVAEVLASLASDIESHSEPEMSMETDIPIAMPEQVVTAVTNPSIGAFLPLALR